MDKFKTRFGENRMQYIYTTIKGGDLPPLMVVYKTSNNMTLEKIYNKWLSIQPLSEAGQNKLSMRFTVEYNYNSNHLEGNTLTYGQTELLLLFGKVSGEGHLKDFNDMKASEVSVKMMRESLSFHKLMTVTKTIWSFL